LDIDSILNWIILNLKIMEVLNFGSWKWVYMLKSNDKWRCKSQKYKTVAGGAILKYSPILKFCKKVTSTIFFMNWYFQIQSFKWFRWKFTEFLNICDWRPLNFSTILNCYFSKFIIYNFSWFRLPKYARPKHSTLRTYIKWRFFCCCCLLIKAKHQHGKN
jgi:hypothetical protein